MKKFLRGLLLLAASASFSGLLFLTATLITFWTIVANPTVIKSWLQKSGVYSSVIDEIAKQTKVEQTGTGDGTVLEGVQITDVAKKAFTPATIQADAEQVIDGVFGWLDGTTPSPKFTIDLSAQKNALSAGIADKLVGKVSALPACTGAQNSVTVADLTALDCLPKNLDLTAAKNQFVQEFNASSSFLPENNVSDNLLKIKDKSGQNVSAGDALPWVPKVYRALLWAPWVSLGLLILSTIGVIALSTKKRKGCARVARGFVFSGGLLVVVGMSVVPATNKLNLLAGAGNSLTQNIINPLLAQVWAHTGRISLLTGGGYVVLGLVIYLALVLSREKHTEEPTVNTVEQPQDSRPQPTLQTASQPLVATVAATPAETTQAYLVPTQPVNPNRVGGYTPPAYKEPESQPVDHTPKRPPMVQG